MHTSLDELPGLTVLDSTGRALGSIVSLQVDTESWAVHSFRLKLRRRTIKALGARWSLFRPVHMDVPTGLVFAAGDAVILRAALEELAPLVEDHSPPAAVPQLSTP
jgi:sporulation protein YlmC with PRC-barrel domain